MGLQWVRRKSVPETSLQMGLQWAIRISNTESGETKRILWKAKSEEKQTIATSMVKLSDPNQNVSYLSYRYGENQYWEHRLEWAYNEYGENQHWKKSLQMGLQWAIQISNKESGGTKRILLRAKSEEKQTIATSIHNACCLFIIYNYNILHRSSKNSVKFFECIAIS